MTRTIAMIAFATLLAAGAAAAEDTPDSPDYSKEKLTLMFRDQARDADEVRTPARFPIFEFKYQSPTNPYLSFALRALLGVAPLPGTTMRNGSLNPVIDPFEMTSMSFPFTPSTFRDRAFERKLRRQLQKAAKEK